MGSSSRHATSTCGPKPKKPQQDSPPAQSGRRELSTGPFTRGPPPEVQSKGTPHKAMDRKSSTAPRAPASLLQVGPSRRRSTPPSWEGLTSTTRTSRQPRGAKPGPARAHSLTRGGPRPGKTAKSPSNHRCLSPLLDRPQGNPPQLPQPTPRREGLVSAAHASRQPCTTRDQAVPGQAQPVPTASRGPWPGKAAEGPPSRRRLSPLTSGAAGETPSRHPQQLVAARAIRARRSSSGQARRRQGLRLPAGSQGSESANLRTTGNPVHTQRPLAGENASSTAESGEMKDYSPKSGRASRCDGYLAGRLAPPPQPIVKFAGQILLASQGN
ncbi:hypothetical protein NDU88_001294 [Pleurodeles waltl]|uniref:Uncharacterized protein n=1 Tax=Pleurodeles waltl TaxID=8319 RepID=A0AAV7WM12_PLEWA|nr:hypothetical protein NDU88_001294 [Pleurodeles waltl]